MSSIKNIAMDMGVSSATVSNALSGKGRVSEGLAARIQARAAELGFQPSMAARTLKTGRSGILGLVMPDISNPLFPMLAQSLESAATAAGYGVLIADSRGSVADQAAAIQRLQHRGVDGLVVIPHRGTRPQVRDLPTAIIHTPTDPANTVSSDHNMGGMLAAKALIELGHRRFLLIGDDQSSEVQKDRIKGMTDAIKGVGTYDVVWKKTGFPDIADHVARGVTAVMTTSDLLALRALGDAHQQGLNVPDDVSVMGFDDLPFATAVRPMLSSVVQDTAQIAQISIEILKAEIENGPPKPTGIAVPMQLVLRGSTAKPSNPSKETQT